MSWRPVAARAASLLLRYPDDAMLAAVPLIIDALGELPVAVAGELRPVAAHRSATPAGTLRADYVDTFDFRRRSAMHLTYYTCGDTRRRGEALAGFAAEFKAAGYEVVDGEIPDHLPAVLDLAAVSEAGWRLLVSHRIGLDMLAESLNRSIYRHAVEAVRAMLPAPTADDLSAVATLARTGPPAEQVGLQPFGSSR
ncbi:nitrate reductase molybdenum cofactor assembly chaperone [Actinoplanes utahensis]|uniref:Nitrate reductase n=1 Tax=Actinoplanes utahensis TaxID=1869 RepID=A0A0A6US90_ACTUT|nr:nitrate reductase molybdenum cofactor assembly chaperone [Actinoplanes utahensis]KHD77314.1 nitrate reductase [Actinoplanes utahensis]GIF32963.1 hypothetical protein Aut01nite_59490 [Actinoplanes utahensis]